MEWDARHRIHYLENLSLLFEKKIVLVSLFPRIYLKTEECTKMSEII